MTEPISLYCRDNERPDAPVLLLLHGLAENGRSFDALLDAGLDARFRVLTPDLRGRGKSPRPEWGYSLEEHCQDLLALLDRLNIKQVYIAGHSFGGLLGLYVAHHHPHRVHGLAMIDVAHQLHPMSPLFLILQIDRLGKWFPSEEKYLLSLRAMPFMTSWDERMRAVFLEDVVRSEAGPLWVLTQKHHVLQAGTDILRIPAHTWRQYALQFNGPALLLSATEPFMMAQPMVPVRHMLALAALAPNGTHLMIPGNHTTMLYGNGARVIADKLIRKFLPFRKQSVDNRQQADPTALAATAR
ncbi:MAG: alpha/beta hydrolase [Sphingobacteriales bacterium]|nr:MAG: alpha/beta hydrolase [Sphingobacteriales bacterium]